MIQEKKNQKKVDYKVLSNKVCKTCGKPIKQNVASRNPYAKHCYVCFKINSGKKTVVKRKFSTSGELVSEKTIDLLRIQKQNKRIYLNR